MGRIGIFILLSLSLCVGVQAQGSGATEVKCAAMPGTDAGVKLQACHDALPSGGGVMDARGITGTQTSAAAITFTKSDVTLLLSPTLDLTVYSATDSTEGLLVKGSNTRIFGHGAVIKATRSLAAGTFFDYFLIRVRALSGAGAITGFVAEGIDFRLTVTGAPAGASATMGCMQLRADSDTDVVSDFSVRNNKCKTDAADQAGTDFRWYGFYGFSSNGTTARSIRNGEFVGNILEESDGRHIQVFRGAGITFRGNIIRNPSPGNDDGGTGVRLIGVDHAVVEGNTFNIQTSGGMGAIYVGGTDGVAGDESHNVSIVGNVCRSNPVMTSSDTYCLRLIGAQDVTVSGNVFINGQASAGGMTDGIKISSATSLVNKNINISGNRIAGFLGYQIRIDDTTPPENLVAVGNHFGDSAAGGANEFGGAGIANLRRYGNYSEAAGTPEFVYDQQIKSTLATGTAPFSIASTTNVANLNASSLSGATFAAPGAIGGGTPAAGTFTTLAATGALTAETYNTETNCSSAASPAVCADAPAGSVVIAAAATTVTVNTTKVTANSQILITEDSSLGTKLSVTCNTTLARNYAITARTAATSFVITVDVAPVTNPACLSYKIVN